MTLNFLEVPVGRKSDTSPIIKHAVRFGRRLHEHGIYNGEFPAIVDDERNHISVGVGKRIINVFSDGEVTSSLRSNQGRYDRMALAAHRNRWHALWLRLAGDSRRRGWKKAARSDLNIAIAERRLYDHD